MIDKNSSKNEVLQAIKNDVFMFNKNIDKINEELLNDKDIAIALYKNNHNSLQFFGDELKHNKDFILELAKIDIKILKDIDIKLKRDKSFMNEVVKENGLGIIYASYSVICDENICKTAIENNYNAFKYIDTDLKNNPQFVKEVSKINDDIITILPVDILYDNKKLVDIFYENCSALNKLNPEFLNNEKFLLDLIANDEEVYSYIPLIWKNNEEFNIDAFNLNQDVIFYMPADFKEKIYKNDQELLFGHFMNDKVNIKDFLLFADKEFVLEKYKQGFDFIDKLPKNSYLLNNIYINDQELLFGHFMNDKVDAENFYNVVDFSFLVEKLNQDVNIINSDKFNSFLEYVSINTSDLDCLIDSVFNNAKQEVIDNFMPVLFNNYKEDILEYLIDASQEECDTIISYIDDNTDKDFVQQIGSSLLENDTFYNITTPADKYHLLELGAIQKIMNDEELTFENLVKLIPNSNLDNISYEDSLVSLNKLNELANDLYNVSLFDYTYFNNEYFDDVSGAISDIINYDDTGILNNLEDYVDEYTDEEITNEVLKYVNDNIKEDLYDSILEYVSESIMEQGLREDQEETLDEKLATASEKVDRSVKETDEKNR